MSRIAEGGTRHGFYLFWLVDGDEGACIGQDGRLVEQEIEQRLKSARTWVNDPDESATYWAAELAAKTFALAHPDQLEHGLNGWVVESKTLFAKYKATVKAAVKAEQARASGRPMPDWATTALAAGWKPPKGWKP